MTEHRANPPIAPEPADSQETTPLIESHVEAPDPAPEPAFPPPLRAVEPAPPAGTPVWLTVVVAVVLVIGLALVYLDRQAPVDTSRLDALDSRLAALSSRVSAVEAGLREQAGRPAPRAADINAIEARIAALERRPAPAPQDVTGPVAAATAAATAPLTDRIAELETKLQQDVSQNAARAAAAAKLRAASAALDAGQPLGDLPDAPPALARFAQTRPPTEPALRLAFPAAAASAAAASKPATDGLGFATRMWQRAQALVTVRQGDKVIVGAPAAVTLNAARGRLEAGDLAGAVAALAPLDGPAAAAMAPWREDAQALLDARAALASLGARS